MEDISCIKSAKTRVLVPIVKYDRGDRITSRKGIANVFGEFYSKIYAGDETEEELQNTLHHETRTDDDEKNKHEGNNEEILFLLMKRFRQLSTNSRKAEPATTMESEPKTSRLVIMLRKKL